MPIQFPTDFKERARVYLDLMNGRSSKFKIGEKTYIVSPMTEEELKSLRKKSDLKMTFAQVYVITLAMGIVLSLLLYAYLTG